MSVDPSKTLLGGQAGLVSDGKVERGVYTSNPASQLKYSTSWDKEKGTLARMYVTLPDSDRQAFINSFPGNAQSVVSQITGEGYIDFLLQGASESLEENVQIIQLLNDDYAAYFFGQRAPTFSYSGMLYTTKQDEWWYRFSLLYGYLLRGTALAEHRALFRLRYDSRIISGALLNFSAQLTADMQMAVPFSFTVLVKDISLIPGEDVPTSGLPEVLSDKLGLSIIKNSQAKINTGRQVTVVRDGFKQTSVGANTTSNTPPEDPTKIEQDILNSVSQDTPDASSNNNNNNTTFNNGVFNAFNSLGKI